MARNSLPAAPFEVGMLVRCNSGTQPWRIHETYFNPARGDWFVVGRIGTCKWYQWAANLVKV